MLDVRRVQHNFFATQLTRAHSLFLSLVAGHGTGVVKKVVQEHLKNCTYAGAYGAASFEQGGDALTVVAVK